MTKEDLELDFDLEGDLGIDTVKQAELFADLKEWANIDESKTDRTSEYWIAHQLDL